MKYKIGTQWKTRGGWRAVVVEHEDNEVYVHHGLRRIIQMHDETGKNECNYDGEGTALSSFDLIEPWVEPVTYEGWVNVYKDSEGGGIFGTFDEKPNLHSRVIDRIACIHIKFTEGEGL